MIIGARIEGRREELGLTQADLARKVGISQQAIARLEKEGGNSRYVDKIARNLATTVDYLNGETDDPDEGAMPLPTPEILTDQLDLVALREIDLTFGMGATYLDVPVTTSIRYFSREWLRVYTGANPDHLFFAQGIGDSMAPTILDSDLLLIDGSQQHLSMADKFWAIAYGNMGSVKRLRGLPNGGVEMISDNPLVPNAIAYDDELHILGRVVAIIRRT